VAEVTAPVADSLDPRKLHFVDVGGVRTRYYEDGQGEPLVLFHGGEFGSLYTLDSWSLNLPGLAEHFHVYAPDKLGHGYTDNPAPDAYTPEALFRHAVGFLEALGLRGAHVAGHSRGGFLVTWLAVERPELVKSLIIVDSQSIAPDAVSGGADDFYEKLGHRKRLLEEPPTEELVRIEPDAQTYHREQVTDDFVARLLEIARLPKTREAQRRIQELRPTNWYPALFRKRDELLQRIDAEGLTLPTLVIWGFDDQSAPLSLGIQLFGRLAPRAPHAELHVLNQARHYCFRDQPAAFNRLLRAFCLG
jgi:2-hydroxy-6-oxonona-2,4-dienedioate hydrolase